MTWDKGCARRDLEMAALAHSTLQAGDASALQLVQPIVSAAFHEQVDLAGVLPRRLPRSMGELGGMVGAVGGEVGGAAAVVTLQVVVTLAVVLERLAEVQQVPIEAAIADVLDHLEEEK